MEWHWKPKSVTFQSLKNLLSLAEGGTWVKTLLQKDEKKEEGNGHTHEVLVPVKPPVQGVHEVSFTTKLCLGLWPASRCCGTMLFEQGDPLNGFLLFIFFGGCQPLLT